MVKVSLLPEPTPAHPSELLGLPVFSGLGVLGHTSLLGGPACLSRMISQSRKETRKELAWEGPQGRAVEALRPDKGQAQEVDRQEVVEQGLEYLEGFSPTQSPSGNPC